MAFKALLVSKEDKNVTSAITDLTPEDLPEGDVRIRVEYSTMNYKDGMVVNGIGGLVRNYPHVPGIDFAGGVIESSSADYQVGDKVVLTGWRVGEVHWGGLAQQARVNSEWLVPLPKGFTTRQAMAVGTAGFTAMMAVMALEEHGLTPDAGPVLVTGASGGVGSVATAILAHLGYEVAALTGRVESHAYLKELGATTIVDRAELSEPNKRPLESERWAACIDNAGSTVLARALAQLKHGASAAAVGLAAGPQLETTVIPFLLRGVNLLGIESVTCPFARRLQVWEHLAEGLPFEKLEAITSEITLAEVKQVADDILKGQVRGRVVVNLQDG